jgi:2-polyprenyl-3-methyl-5-hydroxy-6-metoxy-1,4-benzoquinol methylase
MSDEPQFLFSDVSSISRFLGIWLDHRLLPDREEQILKGYYSNYCRSFTTRLQSHYEDQTSELMNLVLAGGSPDVLEIGCGCGTESLWMAMRGARVHGIDVKADRLRVAECRQRVLERELRTDITCRFECIPLLELDEHLTYDIVWLEQAFHHLEPREEVLEKIVSLLKPGGHVVISEANALNPILQAQLVAKRGFTTVKTYTDERGKPHAYGNERVISGPALRGKLERLGFTTVSLRHFRLFPHHRRFDAWARMEEIVPKWLYPVFTHYTYVGQKELVEVATG